MLALWLLSLPPAAAPPPSPRIEEFALRDAKGHTYRLSDWREQKAVVVVFLTVDCPLAKLYAPRLNDLANRYRPGQVAFVALAPSRHDTPADLARFVRQHDITFPVLKDTGGVIADRFGAERSPEAFVLDEARRIRYRGRIDDQYGVGVQKPRASRHDLVEAIESVLAGRTVAVARTAAPGCPLARETQVVKSEDVTYTRDIAPVLQKRCQVCHRPGQSAPFSLMNYRQASGWARAMREVIEEGRMPPWGANPKHGRFANDPSLTEREKDLIFRWIDAGCPEGDPRHQPAPATFPDGWSIPGPDVVLSMPEPFTVPAEGVIEYQYIRVDPGFREDKWIRAAEIMPGNKSVVHHCNVFLQPPGVGSAKEISATGTLGSYCLTMTAPGTPPMMLPDGMAKRIPAGWKIIFVIHYQSVGSVQQDQTRLALTFADPRTVKQEVATKLMYDPDLRIPSHARDHTISQTWEVNRDVILLSFFPHMHLRGKSFRYELIHPDGREEILLDVPRYDFNWQHRYELSEPRKVAKSSRIRTTAVYDNSASHPANPDPSAEVRAGEQSWDEMYNGYFDVVLADEDLTKPAAWPVGAWRTAQGVCRPGVSLLLCCVGGLYLGRRRIAKALGATASSN